MTFHADFWVATATAAPVIALSTFLVNGDLLQMSLDLRTAKGEKQGNTVSIWKWPYSLLSFWYLVTATIQVLQSVALLLSLMSLASERNVISTTLAADVEFASLAFLGFTTLEVIRLKTLVKHIEEVHFPPRKPTASPRPYRNRNPQTDAMGRAARYRSSHQITKARSAWRGPHPRKQYLGGDLCIQSCGQALGFLLAWQSLRQCLLTS